MQCDTGLVPDAATDPVGVSGATLAVLPGLRFTTDTRVDRQIEAVGFTTSGHRGPGVDQP